MLPIHPGDKQSFFLYAGLILETIWKIRNNCLFEGMRVDLEEGAKIVHHRFKEFYRVISLPPTGTNRSITGIASRWSPSTAVRNN